jgi:hypothetical protein
MLLVPAAGSGEWYVVYPKRYELGVALRRRFVRLPGCVLSLDNPATYIPLGKLEAQSESAFGERKIQFRGATGETVVIRW